MTLGANSGRALRRDSITRDDEARFWRLVEKGDGCWTWRAVIGRRYGHFRLRLARQTVAAHRVAAALAHGDLASGSVVLHRCDNPACVRPDHLEVGTQLDNVRDMRMKGRHRHANDKRALAS